MSSSFFCLSPFHSQRLMFVLVSLYGTWTKTLVTAQHGLFIVSGRSTACWSLFSFSSLGVFFYFNSALKPILYYAMSKRFRHGFSDTKRKVLNPAEPSRKMRIDRLAAVRMFKRRDDHPDEILMYAIFSFLHCISYLNHICCCTYIHFKIHGEIWSEKTNKNMGEYPGKIKIW